MNTDLQYLIKIAKIDKEASMLEPKIAAIEEKLNVKIKTLNQMKDEIDEIKNNIKKSTVEIANNELLIQENNERLEQIDKKMANAKSERELRALDAENGLAKEKIAFANEEINHLEKEIEQLKEKEKDVLEKIEHINKEIETTKVEVEKKTEVIKANLKKIFDSKDKLTKKIDHKIIVFYEKVRKWAKDTSVVPVKKQACSGCFIKINDRIFVELTNQENITTCPHCGRILYIENVAQN